MMSDSAEDMLNTGKDLTGATSGRADPVVWTDEEGEAFKAYLVKMNDVPGVLSEPIVLLDEFGGLLWHLSLDLLLDLLLVVAVAPKKIFNRVSENSNCSSFG